MTINHLLLWARWARSKQQVAMSPHPSFLAFGLPSSPVALSRFLWPSSSFFNYSLSVCAHFLCLPNVQICLVFASHLTGKPFAGSCDHPIWATGTGSDTGKIILLRGEAMYQSYQRLIEDIKDEFLLKMDASVGSLVYASSRCAHRHVWTIAGAWIRSAGTFNDSSVYYHRCIFWSYVL